MAMRDQNSKKMNLACGTIKATSNDNKQCCVVAVKSSF